MSGDVERKTKGLKGTNYELSMDKYKSQIMAFGQKIYLGMYDTEEEAHKIYVDAAKRLFGDFFRED